MTETLIQWELVGSWESPAAAHWPLWPLASQESKVFDIFSRPVGKKENPAPFTWFYPASTSLPLFSLRALATRGGGPFHSAPQADSIH